jgi:ketosteroid isomerase-like protein
MGGGLGPVNFYWKVGLAMTAVLAVAIVVILVLPRGEEREIEKQIRQGIDAARQGDADAVIALISPHYGGNPEEYQEVCGTIRQYIGPGKYQDLEVDDIDLRVFGDSAAARFKVRVVGPKNVPYPYYERWVDLDLQKENGHWRVIRARSDPVRPGK